MPLDYITFFKNQKAKECFSPWQILITNLVRGFTQAIKNTNL